MGCASIHSDLCRDSFGDKSSVDVAFALLPACEPYRDLVSGGNLIRVKKKIG